MPVVRSVSAASSSAMPRASGTITTFSASDVAHPSSVRRSCRKSSAGRAVGRAAGEQRKSGAWGLAVFIRTVERKRIEGTHAERG